MTTLPVNRSRLAGFLRRVATVTALVCLGLAPWAGAEPWRLPRLDFLGVEEGLAHPTVRAVYQDRLGFVWIATESYLQRFDGLEMRAFKHDPDDPHSLSESQVMSVTEDSRGRLWLTTRGGDVNLWLADEERFVRFPAKADDPEALIPGISVTLDHDPHGFVWVGSANGLSRLDPETGRARRFVHDPDRPGSLGHSSVLQVLVDRRGDLWVGHFDGLDRLPRESVAAGGGDFLAYRHGADDPGSLSSDAFGTIFEDSQGTLWVGGWDGVLHRYDPDRDAFERFDSRPPKTAVASGAESGGHGIEAIEEDADGNLWLGTGGRGFLLFDRESESFVRPVYAPDDSLADQRVTDLLVDRSGVVWIAGESGIHRLVRSREQFSVVGEGPGALSEDAVSALAEDSRGRLWVGGQGGDVAVFDGDRRLALWSAGEGAIAGMVRMLVEDPAGRLWVGTKQGLWHLRLQGLDSEEPSLPEATPLPGPAPSVNAGLYAHGALWLGTHQGLWRVDPEDLSARSAQPLESGPRASAARKIYDLVATEKPVVAAERNEELAPGLFLATESGFFHLGFVEEEADDGEAADWIFTELGEPPGGDGATSRGPSSLNLVAVHQDGAGDFWLGSYGGGLNRWRPSTGEWTRFHEKDGLPSDKVVGLLEGADGRLWLATNHGLSGFDPETGVFRNYRVEDGLHGNVSFIGAVLERASGRLAIGGPGGLTSWDPRDLHDDPTPPEVVLTELSLSDEPVAVDPDGVLTRSITTTRELELTHHHRTFSLEIAALHFADPERNRYAYRLDGYDDDWVATDALHRRARYTNLDPGDYVFRAKASNKDGVWSDEVELLRVRLLPPWWRTGWAYAFYVLALAAAVFGYVYRHRAELAKERAINERLRQVDRLKDELLSNTSHELRTPLQGITGLAESLIDGARGELPMEAKEDLGLLLASGRRLSVLVDDLLDFAELDHREELELRRRSVDLHAVAQVVLTLTRPLLDEAEVELVNEVLLDLPPAEADEHRLVQVLHNLVGNAVKFTSRGSIRVRAREEPSGVLRVEVADTGIGIPKAEQSGIFEPFRQADGAADRRYGGTGLGLAVSRRLVELHGGEIGVESTPGEGALFYFTLPRSEAPAERTALLAEEPARARPVASRPVERRAVKGAGPADVPPVEGRLLVVDDEAINRRVLSNFLAAEGYRVEAVDGGERALEVLKARRFDLVLLDIMMPRVSGYDVCREARKTFTLEELPIIFLSAKIQPADVVAGLALGANDFLLKPISKAELLARIRPHLALLEIYRHLGRLVEEKVSQIKVLGGLLPICSGCKRIRDDEGYWAELETFISEHSEATFTHGMCPSCARRHFSELSIQKPLI